MYSFPSTSHKRAPAPRSTKNGSPPTARNARTGELTPPGKSSSARANRSEDPGFIGLAGGSRAEVAELQLEAEILLLQHRDDCLKLVDGGRLYPNLVVLNLRLHLLEAPILDRLDDLLRLLGRD